MPELPDLRDRLWPRSQPPARVVERRLSRATARSLAAAEHRTVVRLANVQGNGMVQGAKLHEFDHLTREAMNGQAFLSRWRQTVAADDLFLADELHFFTDMAKMAKGEILADTLEDFCKESRS